MESLTGASPLGVTFLLALGVVTSGSSHPRGWSWPRLDTSFWGLALALPHPLSASQRSLQDTAT